MEEVERAISLGMNVIYSSCWYLDLIEYGTKWSKYYQCDPADATYGNLVLFSLGFLLQHACTVRTNLDAWVCHVKFQEKVVFKNIHFLCSHIKWGFRFTLVRLSVCLKILWQGLKRKSGGICVLWTHFELTKIRSSLWSLRLLACLFRRKSWTIVIARSMLSTPNLEYLLIMTRCNCKTRDITLKAIFLELCPFLI